MAGGERPTVGVVGAGGTMGSQISAFLAYQAGYKVIAYDQIPEALGRVDSTLERTIMGAASAEAKRLRSSLASLKGVLDKDTYGEAESRIDGLAADRASAAAREALTAKYGVKTTTTIDDLAGCDAIIEAVFEDIKVKERTWREMDRVAPNAYKYTNSSSMGPGMFYGYVKDPSKVAGLHFFNPLHNNPLVEIISGKETGKDAVAYARKIGDAMKRVTVYSADAPGFIVNAGLFTFMNHALEEAEMGIGDIASIDRGMVFGLSHTIGPFALMDFVGLQVVYGATKGIQDYLRKQAQRKMPGWLKPVDKVYPLAPCDYFRPSPLLEYVARDLKLNGKEPEGLGFYNWLKFPRVNGGNDGRPGMPDEKLFPKGYEFEPNPLVVRFLKENQKALFKYHMERKKKLMQLHVPAPGLVKPGLEQAAMEAARCR